MIPEDCVTVYVTADSEDIAVHISTALVREKLIACANVETGLRSIYERDGIIQLDNEVAIVMKTVKSHVEKIIERVKEIHSYNTPCITFLPIIDGNPDYLEWVVKQTTA